MLTEQLRTYLDYNDVELEIVWGFTEGETPTYDYPGSPAAAEAEQIKVNGVDILHLLGEHTVSDIEEELLKSMTE